MAITIHSHPDTYNTLYGADLQYKLSSSRVAVSESSVNISSVADNGSGAPRFTTASAHGLASGDIVVIAGTTTYDGTHEVTVITTTTFDITALTYSVTKTGTVTRHNENFKIKCLIQNHAGTTTYATKYIYPVNESGSLYFYLKVDRLLYAQVDTEHQTKGFDAPTASGLGCNVQFQAVFTEVFDDEDGVPKDGSSETTASNYTAFNMIADYDAEDYLQADGDEPFLSASPKRYIDDDEEWQLHANHEENYQIKVTYEMDESPGDDSQVQWYPPSTGLTHPAESRCIIPINKEYLDDKYSTDRFQNCYQFKVELCDVSGGYDSGSAIGGSVTFYKRTHDCERKTLQFLNWLGGFDNVTFLKHTKRVTVQRDSYTSDSVEMQRNMRGVRRWVLVSDMLTTDEATFLQQLITSPEVYLDDDDEWKRVRLITSEWETKSHDVQQLTLEIEEQQMNIVK